MMKTERATQPETDAPEHPKLPEDVRQEIRHRLKMVREGKARVIDFDDAEREIEEELARVPDDPDDSELNDPTRPPASTITWR